ncbi:MAG: hypothetical protein WBM44_01445 [Waterburya sp.]
MTGKINGGETKILLGQKQLKEHGDRALKMARCTVISVGLLISSKKV